MNVALIGSVSSSRAALEALLRAGIEVTCACGVDESQAAKVSDYQSLRGVAEGAGVPFLSFIKVTEPPVAGFLQRHPADLLWVIGLSQLVPDDLIALARCGGVGFHPTMLPEGRGRAPVAWTILLGARAAVSLFYLAAEADAGDLIAQREVPVLPDDYSEDLIARTNVVLGEVVAEIAPLIKAGRLPRRPQDLARATHYAKRTPADGLIDWAQSADDIYRLVRAAGRPYPGAFTHRADGTKLTIWRARPATPQEHVGDTGVAGGTGPCNRGPVDEGGMGLRTRRPVHDVDSAGGSDPCNRGPVEGRGVVDTRPLPGRVVGFTHDAGALVTCGHGGAIVLTQVEPGGGAVAATSLIVREGEALGNVPRASSP